MSDSGGKSGRKLMILNSTTPIFNLKLYIVSAVGIFLVLSSALLIFLCFCRNRKSKRFKHSSSSIPLVSKEIVEIKSSRDDHRTLSVKCVIDDWEKKSEEREKREIVKEMKKSDDVSESVMSESESSSTTTTATTSVSVKVENMGWGRCYALRELEIATQKEFKVEVEAIGKVRHKNLVDLVGYCAEGARRILVYEYVNNGNLEQWLHGDVGPVSPLTWDIRMRIAVGTAKGLAYLHEGLEPKVVHRDIKSSNILLDRNWNPKVSDFGLAKLIGSEASYVTTRVMGTFGYVSPEYASTGMLNEGSDVYSFGVLLMEIITGRSPVDYSRPAGEMNLVDWFKGMVASRREEELVDPLIEAPPSSRALKRALLVCLRCIDLDASKRPKMGQILHMLEADEFLFRVEPRPARETTTLHPTAAAMVNFPNPSKDVVRTDVGKSKRR
ncbi:Protein kinase domain [Dillenia turbinata]|uniref:non-specific serine/threonine protein kinase n=1 Tax=Dillenia turbinata TaxID=194707 RepID=A0AAN8UW52_9MAGN